MGARTDPKIKEIRKGTLILAGNSLGNDADIPARSLDALRNADLLIFEEDRYARKSLKAAGIHRDYLKYTEHKEANTLTTLDEYLKTGKVVCYMSDQGMPTVADPGADLLAVAYARNATVSVIPGPCSISASLAACPFLANGYRFVGFLPRDAAERRIALKKIQNEECPLVILDTPYRLTALLDACLDVFGAEKNVMIAFDISGPAEEFILGTIKKLLATIDGGELKRNFVLIIDSNKPKPQSDKHMRTKTR